MTERIRETLDRCVEFGVDLFERSALYRPHPFVLTVSSGPHAPQVALRVATKLVPLPWDFNHPNGGHTCA